MGDGKEGKNEENEIGELDDIRKSEGTIIIDKASN